MQGFFAEILDGSIQRKAVTLAQGLVGHLGDGTLGIVPAAGLDGAFTDGFALVRDDAGRVDLHKGAKARTFLTGTKGVVETEHAGRQFFHRDAVLRAGIALAEHHRLAADDIDNDQAVCLGQGGLNGICQTAAHCIADDQAVDHDFHGMLDVLFEVDLLAQIVHVAVNAHTYKTGAAGGVQLLGLGAFAGTDYGGQHLEAGALRQLHHLVDHLINRLLGDLPPANRAVRHANAGIHQAQVVVNFGHSAHGGTWVVAGGLLVDGDGRRKAGDLVHIGLFHLAQELAGVTGKALHIAALAVGVDGVKGKAGLAGAGKSCHDDQLIAG